MISRNEIRNDNLTFDILKLAHTVFTQTKINNGQSMHCFYLSNQVKVQCSVCYQHTDAMFRVQG